MRKSHLINITGSIDPVTCSCSLLYSCSCQIAERHDCSAQKPRLVSTSFAAAADILDASFCENSCSKNMVASLEKNGNGMVLQRGRCTLYHDIKTQKLLLRVACGMYTNVLIHTCPLSSYLVNKEAHLVLGHHAASCCSPTG